MQVKEVKSPLSGGNVKLIREYDSKIISRLYQKEFNVDVTGYFNDHEIIRLYECIDSGYRYFYPNSLAGDGKFYDDLNRSEHQYYSPWKWEHQIALEFIRKKSVSKESPKLLEVGCAEGKFLDKLTKDIKGLHVEGIELNHEAAKIAQSKGLKVHSAENAEQLEALIGLFDFVVCFQVLEHIADVQGFLDSFFKYLSPGGFAVIGVPNNDCYLLKNDDWHTLNLPPHHMGLWNKESLSNLENYFEVKNERIIEEPAEKENLGEYYRIWLKNNLPKLLPVLYPLTRSIVKLGLRVFPPSKGSTIVGIYNKS